MKKREARAWEFFLPLMKDLAEGEELARILTQPLLTCLSLAPLAAGGAMAAWGGVAAVKMGEAVRRVGAAGAAERAPPFPRVLRGRVKAERRAGVEGAARRCI